jgi:hypothetical protein
MTIGSREFVLRRLTGAVAAASVDWPCTLHAQQAERVRHIAVFTGGGEADSEFRLAVAASVARLNLKTAKALGLDVPTMLRAPTR